jgi:hypothetical protein
MAKRAILTLIIALALVAAWAPNALAAGPTAQLDWSMPARTFDANGDGFIDTYFQCNAPGISLTIAEKCSSNPVIQPVNWDVVLDACASAAPAGGTIVDYAFTIQGNGSSASASGTPCKRTLTVLNQGDYTADVTVTDDTGATATTSQQVRVHDILFVSLGDSYGSGEGVPPFADARCDRSTRAASAQAALKLEEADDKTSVTFVHLACSGAQIPMGVDGPYEGVNPIKLPNGSFDVLPSQIDSLKALIGTRRVDLLSLSIGGNDMGFAPMVKSCIDVSFILAFPLWLTLPPCWVDVTGAGGLLTGFVPAARIFANGMSTLPSRFNALSKSLLSIPGLAPERVYITEYPDPTTADDALYCGWPWPSPVNPRPWAEPLGLPGVDFTEFAWFGNVVVPTLNGTIKSLADGFGWNYVGGIASAYFRHGYCAVDRFVNNLPDSLLLQGDTSGSVHPNLKGQAVARDRLFARLSADLANPPLPPAITFYPTALVLSSNTAGANGWTTGECMLGGSCNRAAIHVTAQVRDAHGIKAPLATNLTLSIDGQAATLAASGSGFTCTPANAADACDLFPDPGTNPLVATFVVKLTRGGAHQIAVSAVNVLGKTSSATYDVKVDLEPPTVQPAQVTSGTSGANGWFLSPVGLSFAAADASPGSGLNRLETLLLGEGPNGTPLSLPTSGSAASATATLTDDGDHVVAYESVDNAELRSGRSTLRVKIDTRAPSISGAPDRGPDNRGWYDRDVTVHFAATDPAPGSGIAFVTPDVVLGEGAGQTVSGTATDVAGLSSSTSVGPISVDETAPTGSITGASDGTFTYAPAELLGGTVITNAGSLNVGYAAGDALSGLYQVRLDGVSSSAPTGTLSIPLASGISTHTLTVEDVAGNTKAISFSILSVQPALSGGRPDPQGVGYWKALADPPLSSLLAAADFASRSFGNPDNRYADATLANVADYLSPSPAADLDLKVRRQLLAAWLNLVSGREPAAWPVDVGSVIGWQSIVTPGPRTIAINVLRQVEARLAAGATRAELETIKNLLEAFNAGSLNV